MGYLANKPILNAARAVREAYPLQQFGQPYDARWFDGATACVPTVWQFVIRFWKGRHYTLDQIGQMVGYPTAEQRAKRLGMSSQQEQTLVNKLGLPYRFVVDWGWDRIKQASALGPVPMSTMYSHWPEWRGYRYNGITADGRPNGYAIKNGKTQLSGFSGTHKVCFLGYLPYDDADADTTVDAYHAFVMEPNHNSPSRPEDPPYDIITTQQLIVAYNAYVPVRGHTYAWVPTRTWTKP